MYRYEATALLHVSIHGVHFGPVNRSKLYHYLKIGASRTGPNLLLVYFALYTSIRPLMITT